MNNKLGPTGIYNPDTWEVPLCFPEGEGVKITERISQRLCGQ